MATENMDDDEFVTKTTTVSKGKVKKKKYMIESPTGKKKTKKKEKEKEDAVVEGDIGMQDRINENRQKPSATTLQPNSKKLPPLPPPQSPHSKATIPVDAVATVGKMEVTTPSTFMQGSSSLLEGGSIDSDNKLKAPPSYSKAIASTTSTTTKKVKGLKGSTKNAKDEKARKHHSKELSTKSSSANDVSNDHEKKKSKTTTTVKRLPGSILHRHLELLAVSKIEKSHTPTEDHNDKDVCIDTTSSVTSANIAAYTKNKFIHQKKKATRMRGQEQRVKRHHGKKEQEDRSTTANGAKEILDGGSFDDDDSYFQPGAFRVKGLLSSSSCLSDNDCGAGANVADAAGGVLQSVVSTREEDNDKSNKCLPLAIKAEDVLITAEKVTVEKLLLGLKYKVWIILMVLTTLFVVALILGIVLSKRAASSTELTPLERLMKKYANQLSKGYNIVIDDDILFDETTVQHAALSWLAHQELFVDDDGYGEAGINSNSSAFNDTDQVIPTREPSQVVTPEMVERYILAVFYYATRGEKWRQNNFWLSRESMCLWDGVQCSNSTSATNSATTRATTITRTPLRRRSNEVDGDEVEYYDNDVFSVVHMRFQHSMDGSIPSELGGLQSLTGLELRSADLFGTIPTELGNLQSLEVLTILAPELEGTIPTEIGLLVTLNELLLLGSNMSNRVPTQIGSLTNLNSLLLAGDDVPEPMPTELGLLTKLTSLTIGHDLTMELPAELGEMSDLASLTLVSPSQEGSIPTEVGLFTSLTFLKFVYDQVIGTIPTEVGRLRNLQRFDVGRENLSGSIPSEIGSMNQLTDLDLSSNKLVGTIPVELGMLTRLVHFDVESNFLTGTIPSELSNIGSIYHNSNITTTTTGSDKPRKDRNDLNDRISEETSKSTSFIVAENRFTGTIPTEFQRMTNVLKIYLQKNHFIDNINPIFCSDTTNNNTTTTGDKTNTIDKEKFPRLTTLVADCDNPNGKYLFPEIKCDCCTECYESQFVDYIAGNGKN